mgnify:CR=1 FL=1
MTTIISYTLILSLAAYGIIILTEFSIQRSIKRFLIEGILLGTIILVYWLITDFPGSKSSFGNISSLNAIGLMFLFTILGIIGRYFFDQKKFSWPSFIKPIFISPLILLPLIGSLGENSQIEKIQLISLSILAYQNGFFWNIILEKTKLTIQK